MIVNNEKNKFFVVVDKELIGGDSYIEDIIRLWEDVRK